MRLRWRTALLACAVTATVAGGGVALATTPVAEAQSAPSGPTGDSGNSSCPTSNPPNDLVLEGGTPQTAQLDTAFANPLQVELANTDGCPVTTAVTGTAIAFAAPPTGPSATFAASGSGTLTVGADATGSASVQMLTADDTAGSYTVTASSAYGTVSFSLTNTAAGIPATITALAPTSQRAAVDGRYGQPLAVRVLDADGNPVVGAAVTFSLGTAAGAGAGAGAGASAAAGASFDDGTSQAAETTNADGVATSPGLSANATSGRFTATATVARVTEPARFALDNIAARPHTIAPAGSGSASATVGTHYAGRLRARVRTASGRPVAGATVTFTLGSSAAASASAGAAGAGATFTGGSAQATATTGANGIATSPRLAANDEAGSFTATASASGVHRVAIFHLLNRAGAPATVTAGVGAAQSAVAGSRFAIPLAVTVADAHGNHVANARVTFTAPASGPGGTFAGGTASVTVTTDSSGIAIAPAFTADADAGGYIVTASVHGVDPVAFALVNTAA
jgi:protocatechuate 3,4-dioxygenase beta subunit